MTHISQLLRETYKTFKANFSKLFTMGLPVLLTMYVTTYTSDKFDVLIKAKILNLNTAIFGLITLIGGLFSILFLAPAIYRTVQRNEDTGIFDTQEGYDFQKKNVWKWIMVNVWGGLYLIARTWLYLLPFIAVLIYIKIYGGNQILGFLLDVSVALVAIGLLLSINRFLLFKTIIFSKEISARDAVRESITLGMDHKKDMWKAILIIFLIGLAAGVCSVIVGIVASVIGISDKMFEQYIFPIITVFVISPMLLIVIAKTYVKVRGINIPISPVEEIHTIR
ncbi:hypothetical protein H7Y21_02965 [Arenimonas sp.]|nr:hypothetical protein [Candidatus Parcubacteria bacterium]